MHRDTPRLSIESIAAAADLIDPVFRRSPQFISDALSESLGCQVLVKVEVLNPIRNFKGRGATHFLARREESTPLACASAGNFGLAMAYACRARGVPLTVYAALGANPLKVAGIRALGASVVLEGADFDAAKDFGQRISAETGVAFIEDGREPLISEGAGTIGVELGAVASDFDTLLIPLGNGALLTGVARWIKAHQPGVRIVAVGAAGASAMVDSWRERRLIQHPTMSTIADGIGVRVPIPEALADMEEVTDDALLVSDDRLLDAMRLAHRHLGLVLEPSAVAGLAAILANPGVFVGRRVATILTGGNVTADQMSQWLR